jgi:hypothetical protein
MEIDLVRCSFTVTFCMKWHRSGLSGLELTSQLSSDNGTFKTVEARIWPLGHPVSS